MRLFPSRRVSSRRRLNARPVRLALATLLAIGTMPVLAEAPDPSGRMLRVADDSLQPLTAGWSSATLVPWRGPDSCWLIQTGRSSAEGHDHAAFEWTSELTDASSFPTASDDIEDASYSSFPVFRSADANLPRGVGRFVPVPGVGGRFDLIATSSFRYFENVGEVGDPKFAAPVPILIDGERPSAHPILRKSSATAHNVNGDDVPDLLFLPRSPHYPYWPGGERETNAWSNRPNDNLGPSHDYETIGNSRGYDIVGNWLGQMTTHSLHWCRGSRDADWRLSFGEIRPVYYGDDDYQVQWRTWENQAKVGAMDDGGRTYILMFGNQNEVVALPVRTDGHGGGGGGGGGDPATLRCDRATPLLEGGLGLNSLHRTGYVGRHDFDGDGRDEIVLGSGSFGGYAILAGEGVGRFREVGRLYGRGGPAELDAMACVTRIDWDGDGWPDLINGDASGNIVVFPGTEDPLVYLGCRFLRAGDEWLRHWNDGVGNLQGPKENAWNYIKPTVADWNGDGRLDLIVNDNTARLFYYEGTEDPYRMKPRRRFTINGRMLPVAWRAKFDVLEPSDDYRDDGKPSLLYMDADGDIAVGIPESVGDTEIAATIKLRNVDGDAMRFCGISGLFGRNNHVVCDWDRDGDWDLLVGVHAALLRNIDEGLPKTIGKNAQPFFVENVGISREPVFDHPVPIRPTAADRFRNGKHCFSMWPTDLDGDDRWDLIVGNEEGSIRAWYDDEIATGP